MNYKNHYNRLVETRKNRELNSNEIYERHHIIPKCLGGTDKKDNLISLTYKEHFIAHKLLLQFMIGVDKSKMGYALLSMCRPNNEYQSYRIRSSREYEKNKKYVHDSISGENHPSFGKIMWNEENRKIISQRMIGNHNFGEHPWNYGLTKETDKRIEKIGKEVSKKHQEGKIDTSNYGKKTKEGLQKISDTHRNKPKSISHRNKLRDALKDRKLSMETREKMSNSRKDIPQKKIKCPYCQKEGGTTMYRWHFDNCKYIKK